MALFEPGKPKTGGRKKGSKNKKTLEIEAICQKHGVNIFEAMLEIAQKERAPERRFGMLKELAPYVYPRRSAGEFDLSALSLAELAQIVKAKMAEENGEIVSGETVSPILS